MTKSTPFGVLLNDLRLKKGVGIKKLAPQIGVNYTYLSKLENGHATPSVDLIRKLARYFRYDANVLMLAAGRIPSETLEILQRNPEDAMTLLRERFAGATRPDRRSSAADRGPA